MLKLSFSILSASCMLISFSACDQVPSNSNGHGSELKFDTTKTAILKFGGDLPWIFDSTNKPANLTQNDLSLIDSFLVLSVSDFNSRQEKNNPGHPWKIDLTSYIYRKQLITVTNKKNEKEVWVNCFCNTPYHDWKSTPIIVDDGATCFFNFKINLTTKAYFDFRVNSAG